MKEIIPRKKMIFLASIAMLVLSNCDTFFKEKDNTAKNRSFVALGIIAESASNNRAAGVYLSGTLVGADSVTPISGATITIEGRGENSAIVKPCLSSGLEAACSATTPAGFYQNVLSVGTNPATKYGSSATGAPSTTLRDSECGATVVAMYTASTTEKIVCDSSSLDPAAKTAGISDSLISSGTVVGTITVGADGSFSSVRLPNIATGNTYTIKVSGKTKTRRLRMSKAGNGGFLSNTCSTAGKATTTNVADCTNGNESSKIDFILGSAVGDPLLGTQATPSVEGLGDVATTSSNAYDFNIVNLQIEIVYPKPYDILTGTISSNLALSSAKDYLLSGTVIVPSGVTLTIPAGTRIYGATSPAGALLVKQGGRIDAQGTSTNPIVFSSEKTTGSRAGGDWQGIILQGKGIQTFGGYGVTAVGEGDVGTFGGNVDSDSSGIMRYVRIEFAGAPFSPGNERNCLSLMGVGSGTTLEYIQCHRGYDDGFEIWGGAVNLKYLVASGNRDDQFDYADGWIGRLQFGIAQLYALSTASNDDTSRCIEGDGNSAQTCAGSKKVGGTCSDPSFGNITCVGFGSGQNLGDAIFVRRANGQKAGEFSHFHILEFGSQNSSDCASAGQTASASTVNHTYIVNTAANNGCTSGGTIDQAGVSLTSISEVSPNYTPAAANTTVGSANVNTLNASFDSATYYGAIQNGGTDWTIGWTSYPSN